MKDDELTPGTSLSNQELLLLATLSIWELSIVVIAATLYMRGSQPFSRFLTSQPGVTFLCAITTLFIAGGFVIRQYLESRRTASLRFALIVGMNLVTVVLLTVTGELIVRAGSLPSPYGIVFSGRPLNPKSWDKVRHRYQQHVEKADGDLSYIVYDNELGWTVGPERRSANGLYFSSSLGTRSAHPDMSLANTEGSIEIAMVGDSFTFAEEVRYEESWGFHLGQMLGDKFQLLNYGVPSYGVDQTYLRYQKDVIQRKPKFVLFSLISHDLVRTMWVYPFLAVPQWDWPFSKPRLILRGGELATINVPTLSPSEIFTHNSPSELPFLNHHQPSYRQSDWETGVLHFSYLFRLFSTIYPPWRVDPINDTLTVNSAIIQSFVRSATEAGSIPILIYFPSKVDFSNPSTFPTGKRVLQNVGLPFIDPTPCLLEVKPTDRFLVDHYSPAGNAAVAKCLYESLREVLRQASTGS
ncbi:MAG: hypothetical protein OEV53_02745 [Nitrospira sp.]|nr:hypothetical protein [Nitrospira sp.]